MSEKLVEAIEHCLLRNVVKSSPFDAKEDARDILAAIEASGFAVVPVGRPRCELVSGGTLDEIRANLSSELHATGDCVLVWMNEGDLIQIGFDAMLAAAPKAREG